MRLKASLLRDNSLIFDDEILNVGIMIKQKNEIFNNNDENTFL